VYTGLDPLSRLIAERKGDAVIVAGRNDRKAEPIRDLHAAGFAVLADKPLLLAAPDLETLLRPLAGPPVVSDIMTERMDTSWEVTRHLVHDIAVFGEWDITGAEPAIAIENVHQIHKTINGRVLQRPAWFFDEQVYGDGIVDIPTHLVDLVQWLLGGPAFSFERDVALESAKLWNTQIDPAAFERITGVTPWPRELMGQVRGGNLHVACNGELAYRLRGIPVRLHSIWDLTTQPAEDTYAITLRGTRARIEMVHAMAREGRSIRVTPRAGIRDAATALHRAVDRLQDRLPGVRVDAAAGGFSVHVPPKHERSHEELFSRVLDRFLTALDEGAWDAAEAQNILCKYTLLAEASALARRAGVY
jgi:predicted dehydrogenase